MTRLCFALLLCGATLCLAPPARGDADADKKEALRRGYEADQLYSKGAWDAAYDGFAAADALVHSPVFVIYMAHCRRNVGRLLEAEALYQRVAAEKLADDASAPFREAVAEARAELAKLQASIPEVKLAITGAAPAEVTLTVDGKAHPSGTVVRVDPGKHRLVASHGDQSLERVLDLSAGQQEAVELRFGALDVGEDEASDDGSYVPAIVALSLGGAGLVLGAIAGGIAASKASRVKEGCIGESCLVADADALATAQTLADVSTVAFIVGGVGVAVGGVLLFVRPGGGPVGPTAFVGVSGSF